MCGLGRRGSRTEERAAPVCTVSVYEFRIAPGASFETAFAVAPAVVPLLVETQGEAITYRPDGRGYLTTGEGAAQPVNQVGCR